MTVYIKDFHFKQQFGKQNIVFSYFNGYSWKKLTVDNPFENENVTVYTRYVLDRIIDDLCGEEKDVFKRDQIIKRLESKQTCMVQLNSNEFKDATKIFS